MQVDNKRGCAPVLLALLLSLAACAGMPRRPQTPTVRIVGLRLLEATLFEQKYQLRLSIENPNSFDLPIVGMAYRLSLNDQLLGQGVANQQGTVSGYDTGEFDVQVRSSLPAVLNQLRTLEAGPPQTLRYALEGHLSLRGWPDEIPFSSAGEIHLPPLQ